MNDLYFPHPKYPVKKYTTEQIKQWMEVSYLYALENNPKGDDFSNIYVVPEHAADAHEFSWECFNVLRERGVCVATLLNIRSATWADWAAK